MSYLFQSRTSSLVRDRKCKRMVFLAAICGKSLYRVDLPCDAHVMSASSDGIRQPCLDLLLLLESRANFFFKSACLRGKLIYIYAYMYIYIYIYRYIYKYTYTHVYVCMQLCILRQIIKNTLPTTTDAFAALGFPHAM